MTWFWVLIAITLECVLIFRSEPSVSLGLFALGLGSLALFAAGVILGACKRGKP